MVNTIVSNIRKALDNNLYYVALMSALALPDICGKAEFPNERQSKERYILWYEQNIGEHEESTKCDNNLPYLSGEVIYNLRCSMLHEGNPNLNNKKLNEGKIDKFKLVVENANQFDCYGDFSAITPTGNEYRMSVRRICLILCSVAETYYKNNKDKFHFDYQIIDLDQEREIGK